MRRLSALLALPLLAGCMAAGPEPLPVPGGAGTLSFAAIQEVAAVSPASFGEALNQYRARAGLGGLRPDSHLDRAAQAHAEDMVRHGYFSHHGRDGSTATQRARAAGCNGRGYFAENIAWGQRTAQDVFAGWAASSGHRANMLGRPYGVFGLGQSQGVWVLMFADDC